MHRHQTCSNYVALQSKVCLLFYEYLQLFSFLFFCSPQLGLNGTPFFRKRLSHKLGFIRIVKSVRLLLNFFLRSVKTMYGNLFFGIA